MSKKIRNWLNGVSTVMTIWPDTGSRMRTRFLERSDAEALYGDWEKVGQGIKGATERYGFEMTLEVSKQSDTKRKSNQEDT